MDTQPSRMDQLDNAIEWLCEQLTAATERRDAQHAKVAKELLSGYAADWSMLNELIGVDAEHALYAKIERIARYEAKLEPGAPLSVIEVDAWITALQTTFDDLDRELLERGPEHSTDAISRAISLKQQEIMRSWRTYSMARGAFDEIVRLRTLIVEGIVEG